jgi:hypothetical protein
MPDSMTSRYCFLVLNTVAVWKFATSNETKMASQAVHLADLPFITARRSRHLSYGLF